MIQKSFIMDDSVVIDVIYSERSRQSRQQVYNRFEHTAKNMDLSKIVFHISDNFGYRYECCDYTNYWEAMPEYINACVNQDVIDQHIELEEKDRGGFDPYLYGSMTFIEFVKDEQPGGNLYRISFTTKRIGQLAELVTKKYLSKKMTKTVVIDILARMLMDGLKPNGSYYE